MDGGGMVGRCKFCTREIEQKPIRLVNAQIQSARALNSTYLMHCAIKQEQTVPLIVLFLPIAEIYPFLSGFCVLFCVSVCVCAAGAMNGLKYGKS